MTSQAHSAGLFHVHVSTAGGVSSGIVASRCYYFDRPSITSLDALTGVPAGGTQVLIHGTTFRHVRGVDFGTNYIFVAAVDAAGNESTTYMYSFSAASRRAEALSRCCADLPRRR